MTSVKVDTRATGPANSPQEGMVRSEPSLGALNGPGIYGHNPSGVVIAALTGKLGQSLDDFLMNPTLSDNDRAGFNRRLDGLCKGVSALLYPTSGISTDNRQPHRALNAGQSPFYNPTDRSAVDNAIAALSELNTLVKTGAQFTKPTTDPAALETMGTTNYRVAMRADAALEVLQAHIPAASLTKLMDQGISRVSRPENGKIGP